MSENNTEGRFRELMETATRLFMEQGYEETSVSDIVKACGVAQGTFYYYFKTKEDMLDAIATTLPIAHLEQVQQQLAECNSAKEKLMKLLEHGFELSDCLLQRRGDWEAFFSNGGNNLLRQKLLQSVSRKLYGLVEDILQEGEGEFSVYDRKFLAVVLVGAMKEAVLESWVQPMQATDRQRLQDNFQKLLANILQISF